MLGYNFSIAGVSGRVSGPMGRGGAITVGMDGPVDDKPIPNGTVWNMVYDQHAAPGSLATISRDETVGQAATVSGRACSRCRAGRSAARCPS